jgi:hypothetical protein
MNSLLFLDNNRQENLNDGIKDMKVIFTMVTLNVLFEVQIEFLNNIYMSFGFKGLTINKLYLWTIICAVQCKTLRVPGFK